MALLIVPLCVLRVLRLVAAPAGQWKAAELAVVASLPAEAALLTHSTGAAEEHLDMSLYADGLL